MKMKILALALMNIGMSMSVSVAASDKELRKELEGKLNEIMLLKRFIPKIPLPPYGTYLQVDKPLDKKKLADALKPSSTSRGLHGVAIPVYVPATVTRVEVDGEETIIEIYLICGRCRESLIRLNFGRRIEPEDITPEKMVAWLDEIVDASSLLAE